MTNAEIIARNAAHEVGIYARNPVAFVRGRGCELWDADGRRYLDFFAGLSVNNLGHCHPAVVEAAQQQVATLMHVSNLYHTAPPGELAALLCRHSFAERAFLCNSGAEANEAALKLARRWGHEQGDGRFEILATVGSFHGRTFGTLTATGQEKYHTGFLPLLPGIRLVPYDDLPATAAAVGPETVAIIVEPIQGEGGVVVPHPEYLAGLRRLCDERHLLLIFDEIQCGLGRTGRLWAHEHAGITPDVLTSAKALGGGLPIGAMLTTERVARAFTAGSHGTTFGGNAVACAAAVAAVQALAAPTLLEHVRAVSAHFRAKLEALATRVPGVREVRGLGLMLGMELDRAGGPIVARCLADGLLINCTAERVLRFLPPLVIRRAEIDEGFVILERALGEA
jgi:predicted acetylornithine/succinylornithine family transaminase